MRPLPHISALIFFCFSGLLLAELPPSAYETMQKKATEALNLEVLQVDVQAGKAPGQQQIHIMALVDKVLRTSNNLSEGDVINVVYTVTPHSNASTGQREIPILSERIKTPAYLSKVENSANYQPVAGAMSFRNF